MTPNSFAFDSMSKSIAVTDTPMNLPPYIAPISNLTKLEGDTVAFQVTATDPDTTIPFLTATGLPTGATFVDNGNGRGDFHWIIAPKQIDTFSISFIASDSVLSDTETVEIQVSARLPYLSDLSVDGSRMPEHVTAHMPTIGWQYIDFANDDPQLKFEIAVGADGDWTYSEMWNPAPFNSSDTSVVYSGSPLVNGATYWLRVRVNNALGWSNWKQLMFRMNSVPSVPALLLPQPGAVVNTPHPSLIIHNSIDSSAGGCRYPPIAPTNMWNDFGSIDVMLDGALAPVGTVIDAFDPDGVHCGMRTVTTPGLMLYMPVYGDDPRTPEDEGCVPGDSVRFRINCIPAVVASSDVIWYRSPTVPRTVHLSAYSGDSLYYTFEVSPDSFTAVIYSFAKKQDHDSLTALIVDSTLTENARYWWRVKASDYYEESAYSEMRSFYVNATNSAPAPFSLVAPPNDTVTPLTTLQPTFTWGTALDLDPFDSVSYTSYLAIDSNFVLVSQVPGLVGTSYTVTDSLQWSRRYWWKVKAADRNGGITWSNQVFTFRTVTPGDADNNGVVSLSDVVYLVNYIFGGGPAPQPLPSGDADCSGRINLADAVYLINYIFADGPPPCGRF
jgi:hypothetical protein